MGTAGPVLGSRGRPWGPWPVVDIRDTKASYSGPAPTAPVLTEEDTMAAAEEPMDPVQPMELNLSLLPRCSGVPEFETGSTVDWCRVREDFEWSLPALANARGHSSSGTH